MARSRTVRKSEVNTIRNIEEVFRMTNIRNRKKARIDRKNENPHNNT